MCMCGGSVAHLDVERAWERPGQIAAAQQLVVERGQRGRAGQRQLQQRVAPL